MKALLLIFMILLTGCTTYSGARTKIDQRIDAAERKLNDDAKAFIATANSMLVNVNATRHDPALDRVIDIINKSQIMMGGKLADGDDLKHLDSAALDKKIADIYSENKKLMVRIDELESKKEVVVDKIVSKDIATQAVDDYKFWERFKLYSILLTIISAIVAAFVYLPSSTIKMVIGWVCALFSSKKTEPVSSTTTTNATSSRP